MRNEAWKTNLLKYIIAIGAVTLISFAFVYFRQGNYFVALVEGITFIAMVGAFFLAQRGRYLQSAAIGWLGVFVVVTTLLVTGGIGGIGIVWWSLVPVISFIMFGTLGGAIATSFGVLVLVSVALLTGLGSTQFYFDAVEIRQVAILVTVLGSIMFYFEKISGNAREEALSKSKELEDSKRDLEFNVRELGKEKVTQDKVRKAIINILEDTKEIDTQLKVEKSNVENKVIERTKELAEEKVKLVASINSMSHAYVLVDLNGSVVLFNNKLIEYFGVKNNWTLDLIQENLGGKLDIKKMFLEVSGQLKNFFVNEVGVSGKYYDVHMSPINLEKNKIIGVLLMIGDITEEKMVERSRNEFFSIASHELRTPLTAIRGNTSMIKQMYADKLTDSDLSEMIDDIHDSSIRLIGIVNDFLNLSRLEMGKIEFKKESFDIAQLVNEVVAEVDDKNDAVEVTVKTPKPEQIFVVGDRDRTKEVAINLVGNAIKYSEKGEVKLTFEVINESVNVFVADQGKGIAAENQNLLFRKFQQAESSIITRDTTKSTGLGLYISKLLMDGMGGKVWLEKSMLGEGSVFAFSLPLAKR